jgi:hypothetical protein
MGKDFLQTSFAKAEKKLQQAIALCAKKDACSAHVLARLHRDLAVVYIGGLGKPDAGKDALKKALELDPSLELDADFTTPDLQKAWSDLHDKGKKKKKATEELKPGINHTPVTEQAVKTPVPVFAKVGGSDAAKLRLWYKGVGAEKWASVKMTAASGGFSGQIPCSAVGKEGDVRYFIEAFDNADESVDKSGSRADPYVVSIRKELDGDAPQLPDGSAPDRCKEGEGEGEAGGGAKGEQRKNWVTLSFQQDGAIVGAATGVCTAGIQASGAYSCFRADGSQYLGNPIVDAATNSVNGGLAASTTRILAGYDRLLVAGLTAGVRLGFVVRGLSPKAQGGKPTLPVHFEARLAYWFGSEAFTTATFRPHAFVNIGAAQVDTKFGVTVNEDPSMPASQPNPPSQNIDAYRRMGQGFFGFGGGLMVAVTPMIGIFLDAKYMHLFPTSGNALSPELGAAVGF